MCIAPAEHLLHAHAHAAANAPISEEVISENLGPEDAARWREIIARDTERQQADVRARPLDTSDAYNALTPSSGRPGLLHLIPAEKDKAN